jgi:hypothetical protein
MKKLLISAIALTFSMSAFSLNEKNFEQKADATLKYTKLQNETMHLVNSAIAYYKKHGLSNAVKAFSTNGKFKHGQFYIYIVAKNGDIISHGYNLNQKDNISHVIAMNGQNYVKELFNIAKNPQGGWYAMIWYNPKKHDSRQLKMLYVKQLPCLTTNCSPMIIGSGYY